MLLPDGSREGVFESEHFGIGLENMQIFFTEPAEIMPVQRVAVGSAFKYDRNRPLDGNAVNDAAALNGVHGKENLYIVIGDLNGDRTVCVRKRSKIKCTSGHKPPKGYSIPRELSV